MNPLIDLAMSLHHATDVDQILSKLTKAVPAHFGAERVRLFAYNAVDNEIYTRVRLTDSFEELRFPVSEDSLAGYTALHKTIVVIDDVGDLSSASSNYPGLKYDARYEDHTSVKVRSIISAPMLGEESKLIGIVQLVNTSKPVGSYSKEDLDLLVHIGKLVAAAIFHHDEWQKRATKYDLLLEEGIVSPEELTQAIKSARDNPEDPLKGDPVSVLLNSYGVDRAAMQASLSRYYLTDFLPPDKNRIIPPELLKGINASYFRRNFAVPLDLKDEILTLWISDPFNAALVKELRKTLLAKSCKLYVGFREDIIKTIDHAFGAEDVGQPIPKVEIESTGTLGSADIEIINEDAPMVVQTVNKIILDAYNSGASDIHIEPGLAKEDTTVRLRRDGVCHQHTKIPASITPALINRAKLMASLKIEEHRFPQSGKIRLKYGASTIELRVETTPIVGGKEDVVMRLLAGRTFKQLEDLDMSSGNHDMLLDMISKPYGILLVVGPTGSGKTTTLHAILHHLNSGEKKIWTVEDPVEITQPGLRQVQVNFNIKPEPFDFSRAMRSFLRADPDIIMVGEMRDNETANIAVEASLTGHLVLSTLHTNSAPETVVRLVDMGIDPFNVADSLLGVLGQRLVRVLCSDCKAGYTPDTAEIDTLKTAFMAGYEITYDMSEGLDQLFRPVGCANCENTGFKGRVGIYELLTATEAVKAAITEGQSVSSLRAQALADGMRTMKMDGIRRVVAGQTTLTEVNRVCIY